MRVHFFSFLFFSACLIACKDEKIMFEKLSPAVTGIDFTNTITEDKEHNVFTYQYFYNGNGVAIGDLNNDGRADIFLQAIKPHPNYT